MSSIEFAPNTTSRPRGGANTVIRAKSLEVKLTPPEGKMQVVFGECNLEVGDPVRSAIPRADKPPRVSEPPKPNEPQSKGGSVRPPAANGN